MRTISLKIPVALDHKLTALARRRRTSRSSIVREAVERYAAMEQREPDSVFALAQDLAGSVEGPADLSTNPKHMRGFGR